MGTSGIVDPQRWNAAKDLAQRWVDEGETTAVGFVAGTADEACDPVLLGRRGVAEDADPVGEDAIFLVASITKPVVAMGVLKLVERGEIALGERVERFVPEFGGNGKHAITVRHLLTHTSGLPDMLPNNRRLRERNAGLDAFVRDTCAVSPAFTPGTAVSYQSMGFAMLGEIVRRVSGRACADFLRAELFEPLDMHDTALGAPDSWFEGDAPTAERIVELRLPLEQQEADGWNWNSRYWRQLGVPWGGLLTTPADLGKLARMMLRGGTTADGRRLFARVTIEAATRNQLVEFPDVPEADRRARPWGLGWRMNWPTHSAGVGDLLGPNAYGHFGATGTVLWIDPDAGTFGSVLTTTPFDSRKLPLPRLANAIAAALVVR